MERLLKKLIRQRHTSVEDSNELYFNNELPELKLAYEYIRDVTKIFFQNKVTVNIDTTSKICINDTPTNRSKLEGITEYDNLTILDLGKSDAVNNSEDLIKEIFHDAKHWPNGSGKSPDYQIKLPFSDVLYNLEVKAAKCEIIPGAPEESKLKCDYNNALRNKNGVKEELYDKNSEISNTICIMIYYYVDIDTLKVYYFDADIVAMPLIVSYKIDNGKVIDLHVKSEGENSQNNNASIGIKICGPYDKGNTLYDCYCAFLDNNKVLISNEEYRNNLLDLTRILKARDKINNTFNDLKESYNKFKNNITSINKEEVNKAYNKFNTAVKILLNCRKFDINDKNLLATYIEDATHIKIDTKYTKVMPLRKKKAA